MSPLVTSPIPAGLFNPLRLQFMFSAWLETVPFLFLLVFLALSLTAVARGATLTVDSGVVLAARLRLSPVTIGATIVSLGTTLPEGVIAIAAGLSGAPDLALGNAIGSIICNAGLILGVAALIRPLPLTPRVARRQGSLQLGALALLVLLALVSALAQAGSAGTGGPAGFTQTPPSIPRAGGGLLLLLLLLHVRHQIRAATSRANSDRRGRAAGFGGSPASTLTKLVDTQSVRAQYPAPRDPIEASPREGRTSLPLIVLGVGLILLVVGSQILIPAVEEIARRLLVPQSIVAATLVAFGTSLPELVTAIQASRKGHGSLAVGNVTGANVLNVLFVVGAAVAISPEGLQVHPSFFLHLFPAAFVLLAAFRFAARAPRKYLGRWAGAILITAYAGTIITGAILQLGP